jgi:hypothetical protein
VSAAPGFEFPNPCPVCGATDDHAERMGDAARYSPATLCPHPAEPGHGTGCCCAGVSRETGQRQIQEALSRPTLLEQRVAALEEAILYPPRFVSFPEMSDEDAAKFGEELGKLSGQPLRVMPSVPPLTPEEIRYLLRECIVAVKPGEVLFFRCPEEWTVQQARDLYDSVHWWLDENAPTVKVMIVPDVEMAVVQPGAADGT